MKRSNFTDYVKEETLIYEYRGEFFVMEQCQQGRELNPAHGSRQFPSDISALSDRLPISCSDGEMGRAVIKALDDFDSKGHPYDEFDFPARNKFISSLVGARGLPSLERDSRMVVVNRNLADMSCIVFPVDNNKLNPWTEIVDSQKAVLPPNVSVDEAGAAVLNAFKLSTFHPKRK